MIHTPSISPYAVDTTRLRYSDDISPKTGDNPTLSKGKWWTPWHAFVDADGVLAKCGRIRVVLKDDQWMIERYNAQWKPISFHRECGSLLRVLREKAQSKANAHLASDFLEVRQSLEGL